MLAVPCSGSWHLNKISGFLEEAKGVKALGGQGCVGCTGFQLGGEENTCKHW